MSKQQLPAFWVKNHESFVFFPILSQKSFVFGSRLHRVCVGRSGTSAAAVYAVFSRFCYVGVFGDLSDPEVPTLRSGDMPTRIVKDDFCRLQPCLGPVMACVKDAKSPFPPILAYMCARAGAVFHPGQPWSALAAMVEVLPSYLVPHVSQGCAEVMLCVGAEIRLEACRSHCGSPQGRNVTSTTARVFDRGRSYGIF